MTKQKANPATKKVTTIRAGSSTGIKTKITKADATKTAMKAVVTKLVAKKPAGSSTAAVVAEPKKIKSPAVKEKTILTAEKKAPVSKAVVVMAKPATSQKMMAKVSPEERYRMVETRAYLIAEQHGFNGRSDEHWATAEREIDLI